MSDFEKRLLTMEDIAQGVGKVTQKRGPNTYTLGKVDIPYAVTSVEDMQLIKVTQFGSARVFATPSSFIEYYYDPNDLSGIKSLTGPGSWLKRFTSSAEGLIGPEGPKGDTIQVFLDVTDGVFFRNNTGNNKTVTAKLFLNGEEVQNITNLTFRWLAGTSPMYLDQGANFVSTTPTTGLFPADGNMLNGINTNFIIVDPSDVIDGRNLKITCEIGNIE